MVETLKDKILAVFSKGGTPSVKAPEVKASVDSLPAFRHSLFDGDKFPGGFGPTEIIFPDYWTLRLRSDQLFNQNPYARGMIRRLITNEINTGLTPESCPDEDILGLGEEALGVIEDTIESRFNVYSRNPKLCDWKHENTFGGLQRQVRLEAIVGGDVLVVLRTNTRTGLPMVQVIQGDHVLNPLGADEIVRKGHKVRHGVETDAAGRVVAYWVRQDDGTTKRLPAFGSKSGRRLAWLVFGTEKRSDEVRGTPLLGIILQSLKEIDRYKDSAQRKAVINSILAMFIEKTEDKPSALPMTGAAVKNNELTVADDDGKTRQFNISHQVPGVVMEELQTGEKPVGFNSQGTDVNFPVFEEAIVSGMSWALEMPPEIVKLAFSNNYSASQAAINEFKIYLNKFWGEFGEFFCSRVYTDWLISEVLNQKIIIPGFLEAWRRAQDYDIFGAWLLVEWYGSIKPSTDMLKQAKGSQLLIEMGLTTRAREARGATGTKYSRNVRRLKRENQLLVDARRPVAEFEAEFNIEPSSDDTGASSDAEHTDNVIQIVPEDSQ